MADKRIKELTLEDFEQNETRIRQQEARKRRLKKLADRYHRSKYGDYDDTYEEFYNDYLASSSVEQIPRYASVVEDETYGMIVVFNSLVEALEEQANAPSNGDTLNVPAGVYDLDSRGTKQIETRSVTMTVESYATLCGLVQPSEVVNHQGILGPWEEIRHLFPKSEFDKAVEKHGEDFYVEEAGF